MKSERFGFWKEYYWGAVTIKSDIEKYQPKRYTPGTAVTEYLEKGVQLIGKRTAIKCVFTNEFIAGPGALTDGKYVWTYEYAHYIKEGVISIDTDFLNHMKENNFQILSYEQMGMDRVEKMIAKINNY